MAGEDFTGPPVLKFQSNIGLSEIFSPLMPVSEGLPRNCGQSAAYEDERDDNAKALAQTINPTNDCLRIIFTNHHDYPALRQTKQPIILTRINSKGPSR
jgi:hypothetical protein